MKEIQDILLSLADPEYAKFQSRLTPGIDVGRFIGVRLPALRKTAKTLAPGLREAFLRELPHETYDENLLHAVLLESAKPYEDALEKTERFLPYVDNWAVCDTLRPRVFAKNKEKLLPKLYEWIDSPETYTCRFAIDMLMTHYLDGDFRIEYAERVAAVQSEEYYVRMMAAWYFATALAKQWDAVIPFIEQRRLPEWTHRKAIQKAVESYRITLEQKAYLRTLREYNKEERA